jgi:hypothetical protein
MFRLIADRLHDMEIRVGNTLMTNEFNNHVFDKNPLCAEQIGKGIAEGSSKTFICSVCYSDPNVLLV